MKTFHGTYYGAFENLVHDSFIKSQVAFEANFQELLEREIAYFLFISV